MSRLYPQHCFQKVALERDIIDKAIDPLLAKLQANPQLWRLNEERQRAPGSAHHETESIYVLGPPEMTPRSVFNDLTPIAYPAMDVIGFEVAALTGLAQAFAASWQDEGKAPKLGRVMIANLHRDGVIDPHEDEGAYADHYDRFHLVLHALPGVRFNVGPYHFEPKRAELWWFNHKITHSVVNVSEDDRLHLIIDMVAPYWRMERNKGLAAQRGNYHGHA